MAAWQLVGITARALLPLLFFAVEPVADGVSDHVLTSSFRAGLIPALLLRRWRSVLIVPVTAPIVLLTPWGLTRDPAPSGAGEVDSLGQAAGLWIVFAFLPLVLGSVTGSAIATRLGPREHA